jgi:L-lactate dehydrogenase complex protein LldG
MSRNTILSNVKKNKPKPKLELLPDIDGSDIKESLELKDIFKESLAQVGAKVIELKSENKIDLYIKDNFIGALDFENTGERVKYSDNYSKNKLEKIGTVQLYGQFGVAENGAIWLDESNFPNRLIPFIVEQLIIKLDKEKIVKDMHEAYENINLEDTGFGVFISGPSKTADIEQSLVYGAHGAKQLFVIMH